MKGMHKFIVSNRFVKYDFTIKRNITVIQGDSATGKTVLLNMLESYSMDPENSGVEVLCDVPVFVYRSVGTAHWRNILKINEGSIVFIDEYYDFVTTNEFSEYVEHSDSYFVIVTREDMENLPYSVEEIYRIKESGKYGSAVQVYNVFENIYVGQSGRFFEKKVPDEVSYVITEDSKSGFQFWQMLSDRKHKKCISAMGKSNVVKYMRENKHDTQLVIVDGASFGSQMRRLSKLIEQQPDGQYIIFLPESFEWVLLKSGVVQGISDLQNILAYTYDYVDSKEYMSWERFYTALLQKESIGKPYQYNKNYLNEYFTGEKAVKKIKAEFPVLEKI